jgi:hypothetical protein
LLPDASNFDVELATYYRGKRALLRQQREQHGLARQGLKLVQRRLRLGKVCVDPSGLLHVAQRDSRASNALKLGQPTLAHQYQFRDCHQITICRSSTFEVFSSM